MYRIRDTLDIKSKRLIYSSLIHPYLTYCVNVSSSTYRTNLKILLYCTKEIRACTICHRAAGALEGYFLKSKKFSLLINDKLIDQKEGILAYKVIYSTYLLGDILIDRHELLDHYQLKNYENLRIPLH